MTTWQSYFITESPIFNPLRSALDPMWQTKATWPTIPEYNQWIQAQPSPIANYVGQPIQFVEQLSKLDTFESGYEPSIYLRGEVSTRPESWHDFFNMLVWLTFPKLKAMLNRLQFVQLKQRYPHDPIRTPVENKLTHLDENGVVVVSANVELIELLREQKWEMLFWQRREAVQKDMRFYVVGHALYEKALQPYIGMTGSAIILQQESATQLATVDSLASQFVERALTETTKLAPLPILGVPGWWPANDKVSFYRNENYFRPKGKRAL